MGYVGMPPKWLDASPDATGNNPGNWTNAFTADRLAIGVPWAELYHAVVENVPPGAVAVVQIGIRTFSFTNPIGGSEWDPAQPALIQRGQDVYFYWSAAASGKPPRVTLWLRYDPALLGKGGA